MAFKLDPKQPIRRGLKQVARRQLKGAEEHLRQDREGDVHEARKSVKKVRAIVSLLEQAGARALDKDQRRLRAVGRTLSAVRDTDAMITTFDQLRADPQMRLSEHTSAVLRRHLVQTKTRVVEEALANQRLTHAADTLRAVRRSVKRWQVPAIDAPDLANLVKAGYRAGRKAMRRAHGDLNPSELHRWRKRVKTLWYQLRLAAPLAPALRGKIRRLKQLERWLGEDHNLSLLQATIGDDRDLRRRVPTAVREVVMRSRSQQTTLRRKSFALGERLLTERPKAFARDLRRALSPSPRKAASGNGPFASAVA